MFRAYTRIATLVLVTFTVIFVSITAHAGWTPWVTLGGTITSDPAACTVGNWTWVVARGTDSRYYYRRRYLPTGVWDGWKMVTASFQFSGSPGATCLTLNNRPTLMVSGVTANGQLYGAYINDGTWGGWGNYRNGNAPGTGPSLSAMDFPRITHFFVRNSNNTVYWRMLEGGGDFTQVSGLVSADPASAVQSAGRADLVVRARDGYLRHAFWDGGSWYGYSPVGGVAVLSAPDLVSRAPGSLDLFARGQGNVMLHKRWSNGVWGPWMNLGGSITSGPGATVYASKQRMMVFARWSNGQLYYKAWAP